MLTETNTRLQEKTKIFSEKRDNERDQNKKIVDDELLAIKTEFV